MAGDTETIDAFRRGQLDLDCKRMVLTQRKTGGVRFEGQGYIRQTPDGAITLKLYVTQHNAKPFADLHDLVATAAGGLYPEDLLYDLEAVQQGGTQWTATRIMPDPHWDTTDMSVLMTGKLQAITARLDRKSPQHYLRLHFFDQYDLPLNLFSNVENNEGKLTVRDRAKFEACGSKFEVRVGDGDTIVEAHSEEAFPDAFDLRIQEALQFVTAKTAFWRARVESKSDGFSVELAAPSRKSSRTQFGPPLSPNSIDFQTHGWRLFGAYLQYLVANTTDTYWNHVAYHLNNACEATAGSLDAWAVGVSVAVEAVASLINLAEDKEQAASVVGLQASMREWLEGQSGLGKLADRVAGLIGMIGNKLPQDTLHALAAAGRIEKSYIKAWSDLRNRHVHPTLRI